jgi:hypothetical protein
MAHTFAEDMVNEEKWVVRVCGWIEETSMRLSRILGNKQNPKKRFKREDQDTVPWI